MHLDLPEITQLAKEVYGKGTEVLQAHWGKGPSAHLLLRDEYGKYVIEIEGAGLNQDTEIRKSIEGHRRYREEKIAEWNLQRRWSAELADLIAGLTDDGPEPQLESRPKLLLERFADDFKYEMPRLKEYVATRKAVDKAALVEELRNVPTTWTPPGER